MSGRGCKRRCVRGQRECAQRLEQIAVVQQQAQDMASRQTASLAEASVARGCRAGPSTPTAGGTSAWGPTLTESAQGWRKQEFWSKIAQGVRETGGQLLWRKTNLIKLIVELRRYQ